MTVKSRRSRNTFTDCTKHLLVLSKKGGATTLSILQEKPKVMKVITVSLLMVVATLAGQLAFGSEEMNSVSAPFDIEAGVQYRTLPIPVSTASGDKIEVVEVFSYACIHCFHFDPAIEAWRQKQPDDVAFRRLPAVFNQSWSLFGQAFYTAKILGVLDKVHAPIFDAIHLRGVDLRNPALMAKLFQDTAGVDAEEFTRVFNSFGVRSRVQQADAEARMYRITGVPTLVVAGKYVVDGRMAGNNTRMLQVADYLVAQERESKKGAKDEIPAG